MCRPLEETLMMQSRAIQLTREAKLGPTRASERLQLWAAANEGAIHGLPVISQYWLYVKDQHRTIDGSHASFIGSALAVGKYRFQA